MNIYKSLKSLCAVLLLAGGLFTAHRAEATVEVLSTGSYIINMGVVPQTVANGLKPYGLLYELLKTYQIPIKWVIGQSKPKDGTDFTYNGVAYKGGTFIIPAEFINSTVMSRIAAYGVTGTTTNSPLSVDVTYTLNTAPKWTLDLQNGKIAEKFIVAAGIPSSAYSFKYPSALTMCDDIFVIPHADPTWTNHGNLMNFVMNNFGSVWGGCKSGSGLENLYNPNNTSQQLNFLSVNVGTAGHALVPNDKHHNGSPPYIHQDPTSPAAQYMGTTDAAQQGGAEQIYMPVLGGSWRPTTEIIAYDPTQQDVPTLSPGPASVIVFGRAYGNSNYGLVMYEASHDISGSSTAQIAAQRAFFDFSFRAMVDKVPVISGVSGASIVGNGGNSYSVTATSPIGATLTYQWSSDCGGTFSNPTGSTTTYTPPSTSTPTTCNLKVVVSDPCRSAFATKPITINNTFVPGPTAVNDSRSISCGADSVTLNVLANDSNPGGGPISFSSFTPASGVTAGGTFYNRGNGNVTFIPDHSFTGTQTINYTITDGTNTASATISITVGTPTSLPTAVADTILTSRNIIRSRVNVKANDADASGIANDQVRVTVAPTKGTTSVNLDGTIDYMPNLDASGLDSFTYQLVNPGGFTASAKVNVAINAGTCGTGLYLASSTSVVNATMNNLGDGYLRQDQAGHNYGSCTTIQVDGETNKVLRGLLQFDVSAIPATATIDSAKLILVATQAQTNTAYSIDVNRVTSNWSEGTACDANGTPNWTSLSSSYDATASATTSVTTAGTYSWDIKSLVQSWVNGTNANDGMLLKFTTEGTNNQLKTFGSRENTTTANRPVLQISYSSATCSAVPTRAPFANPDFASTTSIAPVTVNTASNDVDVAGNKLYTIVSNPSSGTASINSATGSVTYTPAGSFNGNVSIAYRVLNQTTGLADTANVIVTVGNGPIDAINDTPAGDSSNVVQTINVKANDVDPEAGGPLGTSYGVTITKGPLNGTATVNANGDIVYTPVNSFSGRDTLTYQVCEPSTSGCGVTYCDTARVFLTVYNRKPTPHNDTTTTPPCTEVIVNVLANDTDPEGDQLTVNSPLVIIPNTAGGAVNNHDGTITFTPATGFTGTAKIAYTVTDNGDPNHQTSDTALVVINVVVSANHAPVAVNDYADTTTMDGVSDIDVVANDYDPDGNQLSAPTITVNPVHGTATVGVTGAIHYVPNPGYVGADSLTYRINDIVKSPTTCASTAGLTATAKAFFDMTMPNTVIANNDENSTLVNVPVSGGVLFNDFDPEGDAIIFDGYIHSSGVGIKSGLMVVSGVDTNGATVANAGVLNINTNGLYTYTPANGFVGVMSVRYGIEDNNPMTAFDSATLRITVSPLRSNSIIANNDENISYGNPVGGNVKDNDRDPEGDAFNVTGYVYDTNGDGTNDALGVLGSPKVIGGTTTTGKPVSNAGTLVLNSNGTYVFTPTADFHGDIDIVYTICDVVAPPACQSANLHIHVLYDANGPKNDPPYAGDDFSLTTMNVPVNGSFQSNDGDPNGDSLSYNNTALSRSGAHTAIGAPVPTSQGGTVQFYTDGTYRYTPPTGYVGPDLVYYTISDITTIDPHPLSATAMIHLLVTSMPCSNLRVYIEGSLIDNGNAVAADGRPLMRDNLRSSPFTGLNYIPVKDIYEVATPFVDVTSRFTKLPPQTNHTQFRQVTDSATVFGVMGQDAIVDWAFVELRDKHNSATVVATRAGLLQRDGDIVDVDGKSCLAFPGVPVDSYYVAIRHRSHLGTMTKFAQSAANIAGMIDFTVPSTPLYDRGTVSGFDFNGLSQKSNVHGTYRAMWQGDFNVDGKIKYDNPNDDLAVMLDDVLFYPTNINFATNYDFAIGYRQGDFNMNSKVKFDNPNDDNALLLDQVLFYPQNVNFATNFDFMLQQLP